MAGRQLRANGAIPGTASLRASDRHPAVDVAGPRQRGANVDKLWHAAALGMLDRLEELLGSPSGSEPEAVSQAFWHACAAGQRRAAELLLNRGADLNWVPDYAKGTPLDAASGLGTRRNNVIGWLRDQGAQSSEQSK